MAALGLIFFAVGAAMTLAPNTPTDFVMGLAFAAGGLFAIARAYQRAAR